MIRTNSRQRRTSEKQHALYRDILVEAFKLAWHERRLWPLAFFASVLLSMGSYDILTKSWGGVTATQDAIATGGSGSLMQILVNVASSGNILGILSVSQAVIVLIILGIALAAFSIVCQGALVFSLGTTKPIGKPSTVTQALSIGTQAFWPVAALNALSLGSLWILRFFMAITLLGVLGSNTKAHIAVYMISFSAFTVLSFIIMILQIFTLNGVILQGSSIHKSLIRAYNLFRSHWIVTLETALLLFVIDGIVALAVGATLVVVMLPIALSVFTSAMVGSAPLLALVLGVGLAIAIIASVLVMSFMAQLQYATWIITFRKLGEGGFLPKVVRLFRTLTGSYTIPKS